MSAPAGADSNALEALFDSVASQRRQRECAGPDEVAESYDAQPLSAPVAPGRRERAGRKRRRGKTAASLQDPGARSDTATPVAGGARRTGASGDPIGGEVIEQVGRLTREMHENPSALCDGSAIGKTAAAIPDARDRLDYVARMTERAAERVLDATDIAKPLQDDLLAGSAVLCERWDAVFAGTMDVAAFRDLAIETRAFLARTTAHSRITGEQLMAIVMAQDFQDLTGQVIRKVTDFARDFERQLLQVLAHTPPSEAPAIANDGPLIDPTGRTDAVTEQREVDDLLAGFGL